MVYVVLAAEGATSAHAGTPAVDNRRIASLVPGARYEEIAGMRHFPNVEAPDAFNRIMLGWLEAQKKLN